MRSLDEELAPRAKGSPGWSPSRSRGATRPEKKRKKPNSARSSTAKTVPEPVVARARLAELDGTRTKDLEDTRLSASA
jgi:hypothetical protein